MTATPRVVIDYLPESAIRYSGSDAIVAVDVIRATTTAVTGLVTGRRCFLAASLEAAIAIRARLENALLVGELKGDMPTMFELPNSPAELAERTDVHRPMILLSTSGTRLICTAAAVARTVYVACLRNVSAQIAHIVGRHQTVAVIGAGSRGEFRLEDQLCCAWLAGGLIDAGYTPQDGSTKTLVDRWRDASTDVFVSGASADYLRRTGQQRDLDFVLANVDDVKGVFVLRNEELVPAPIG